jgi:endonuclease/exonuclease/phosphatase family metal-dependent hydrolase
LIYQSGLVAYSRREQSEEMFANDAYRNVQKHLFADFEWGSGGELQRLKLVNVHFKATPESADVRQKQARLIRHWLEEDLARGVHVIALGDFNTEDLYGHEPPGSEMLILRQPTAESIPLRDLDEFLPAERQLTHLSDRAFDRILVSPNLLDDEPNRRDLVFTTVRNFREAVIRGEKDLDHRDAFYQIPQEDRDASDHYPLLAEFVVQ